MTNTTQNIISIVLTFVISRTIYWVTGFQPVEKFSIVVGTAIDVLIWIVLYFIILWLISKIFTAKREIESAS